MVLVELESLVTSYSDNWMPWGTYRDGRYIGLFNLSWFGLPQGLYREGLSGPVSAVEPGKVSSETVHRRKNNCDPTMGMVECFVNARDVMRCALEGAAIVFMEP